MELARNAAKLAAVSISLISMYVAGIAIIDPLLLRPMVFGIAIATGVLNWPLAREFNAGGARAIVL